MAAAAAATITPVTPDISPATLAIVNMKPATLPILGNRRKDLNPVQRFKKKVIASTLPNTACAP